MFLIGIRTLTKQWVLGYKRGFRFALVLKSLSLHQTNTHIGAGKNTCLPIGESNPGLPCDSKRSLYYWGRLGWIISKRSSAFPDTSKWLIHKFCWILPFIFLANKFFSLKIWLFKIIIIIINLSRKWEGCRVRVIETHREEYKWGSGEEWREERLRREITYLKWPELQRGVCPFKYCFS